MKRRIVTGSQAAKKERRRSVKRRRPVRAPQREAASVTELLKQLTDAIEQQAATSEVLQVISRSTFDLKPVLEGLLEKAVRLSGADRVFVFRQDGNVYRVAAKSARTNVCMRISRAVRSCNGPKTDRRPRKWFD